jgi:hypothetical protein
MVGGAKKAKYSEDHYILSPHILLAMLMLVAYGGFLLFGLNGLLALLGAVGFGFITNNLILMEAGHSTKLHTLVYVLPLLAAAWLTYRRNVWLGLGLFAFFLAIQIRAYHIQITYYTLLCIALLAVAEFFRNWKAGQVKQWVLASGFLAAASVIGVLSNTTMLWTTYEYAAESIRGRSDLASEASTQGGGLDKDYIFQWSLGKMESFTLFIPHFYGGGSAHKSRGAFAQDKNSQSFKELSRLASSGQIPQQQVQQVAQLTGTYWGAQPFTAGPIYYGMVLCFLFVLGMFAVRGPEKWWLAGTFFFFLALAWGKNFAVFNNLMVDLFPMYNKFRAVTMTLTVAQVLVVLLGLLGLKTLHEEAKPGILTRLGLAKFDNGPGYVLAAGAVMAGLLVFALLFSYMGHLEGKYDAELLKYPGYANLVEALQADRASLLRGDVYRGFAFLALAMGLTWLYAKAGKLETLRPKMLLAGLLLVSLVDQWTVNNQYVNQKSFVSAKEVMTAPEPSPATAQVMKDPDPHFRVLDLTHGDPFTSATPCFYYKNVGGYHAAKPMLYQNVAERYFSNNDIFGVNRHILQMLNVKYIVQDPQTPVLNGALGNAWFVNEVQYVPNADEEIKAIGAGFTPQTKAITQEANKAYLEGIANQADSSDNIRLEAYHPERMIYKSSAKTERLAVFSEIYYPPAKGWKVYVDGQAAPDFIKVNYLLRGLRVPAGQHTIEMRFEPKSHSQGETLTLIGSLLALASLGLGIGMVLKKKKTTA